MLLSGQIGIDPATGAIVPGGTKAECAQVFANIVNLLEAVGMGLGNVVKTTVFLPDLEDFTVVNAFYENVNRHKAEGRELAAGGWRLARK